MIYKQNAYGGDFDIVSYKGDWGIPIIFSAYTTEGFDVGDTVVFVTQDDIIPAKTWKIASAGFEFPLRFTEEEARKLSEKPCRYSFKRYRNGQYLETLANGNIIIKDTVLWQN